ncbi:hypothetical protein LTR10_016498 [Elasticomyces elasticus]|uniref:Uncharacterized protein n=1 Tax=Exophiala sideris TaxID=1016849 RepID=A0ABR0IYQ3_9EURO|nr:hypothetical protein LTR10_016498 [Elasticomyces elasticus]KAK5022004.1 hypothetical protein LTS07_010419 [Exophiala sideris]KAK5026328.1 hypothetical protein LTR13_010110 [Exophiala sideris]KAK5051118.1 hypothetical protein LTR69_010495 [Exophiala sideris]KAK5177239.1 hypothetical protein LTR44_010200 [Eurotiomycetes sp. CCFEE 6388]
MVTNPPTIAEPLHFSVMSSHTSSSSTLSALAKFDMLSDERLTAANGLSGICTPLSSNADTTESSVSEATLDLRKDLDQKLEALVLAEETSPPYEGQTSDAAIEPPSAFKGPIGGFECAFGFTGTFQEPCAPLKSKGAFLVALKAEIEGIGKIQSGLQAYQHAINSRKYHIFSTRFLIGQNTATIVTLDQLDQIVLHLKRIEEEVQKIEYEETEVEQELFDAFRDAQPWVARTRAILIHSHVFYKINFVLASEKTTRTTT